MREKVEIFEDSDGEFRWRLISSKRVIASSEKGYTKKAGAKAGIKSTMKALTLGGLDLPKCPIVDLTLKIKTT